jgi:exodeoxyribonuclease-5
LQNEQVVAVCFAKIRSDETKLIGLSLDSDILPGVLTLKNSRLFKEFESWENLLQHWHANLEKIAIEIKTGIANVSISNEADLIYCDVKPLLRLPERLLQFEHLQSISNHGEIL